MLIFLGDNMAIENKILELLKGSEMGLSMNELSKETKVERHTLTKYLNLLMLKGFISFKQVGMGKVWHVTKSPVLALFEDDEKGEILKNVLNAFDDKITIIDMDMNVIWSNHKNTKKCYESFEQSSTCQNCPSVLTLKSGKKKEGVATLFDENGNKNLYEFVSNPIKDSSGKTIAVIEITRDLTRLLKKGGLDETSI